MRSVADDAALADLPWLQFKLRLDQHQQMAVGLEQAHHGGQYQGQRDERQIAREKVEQRVKAFAIWRRVIFKTIIAVVAVFTTIFQVQGPAGRSWCRVPSRRTRDSLR